MRQCVLLLLAAASASAHTGGVSGYSGKTAGKSCVSCHPAAAGSAPTVTLTGPSSLGAGSTGSYTLTVSGGPGTYGTIDVAVDSASAILQPSSSNTKLLNGEVVHPGLVPYSSGSAAFLFKLVAPSAPGTVTLYATGLSSDGSGKSGDRESLVKLAVTVGQANQPPSTSKAASASPNPVAGNSSSLSVAATDDGGEPSLTYTWASKQGPAPVGFSPSGSNAAKTSTATFSAAGAYTLEVTVRDLAGLTATSAASVSVSATPTAVRVTPQSTSVAVGKSQQFTASVLDQFGAPISTQPSCSWTASGGGISGTGLYTAGSATGSFSVSASCGGLVGTAAVTVSAGSPPVVTQPAAASPNPASGTGTSLTVSATDDGGEPGLAYSWTSTGPGQVTFVPNGSNAAKAASASFAAAGSYSLQVSVKDGGGLTATSSVGVTVSATPSAVTLVPSSATLAPGAAQQFTATVVDQFGAPLAAQPSCSWAATGGSVSSSGLYTAGSAAGTFTVTAGCSGKSRSSAVTVMGAPRITQPATAASSTVTGVSVGLTVAADDDGGEPSLTYTWASAAGALPVLFSPNGNNAGKASTATFSGAGAYSLEVTVRDAAGLSATSLASVTVAATPTTVLVNPPTAVVAIGRTQPFTSSVLDQFFDAIASTPACSWSVSGGGSISSTGLFTAGAAPGTFTVSASCAGKVGTATVSVAQGAPPTLAAPPSASPARVTGNSTVLTVFGADDGGEGALTYTWEAPNAPRAVGFSANGSNAAKTTVATFSGAGRYGFTVTVRDAVGLSASGIVTVDVISSMGLLTVSPATTTVALGRSSQFSATATDQFGDPRAPGAVSWTASGGGSVDSGGLFTATTAGGPYAIRASAEGRQATASVSVVEGATRQLRVQVLEPRTNALISERLRIRALVSEAAADVHLVAWLDGSSVAESDGALDVELDARGLGEGSHLVLVEARDSLGNEGRSPQVLFVVEGGFASAQGGCAAGGWGLAPAGALLSLALLRPRKSRRGLHRIR